MKNENQGLRIKLERIRKGVKQLELAERVGIGAVRLCRIEKGKAEPKPEELARIKQALQEITESAAA